MGQSGRPDSFGSGPMKSARRLKIALYDPTGSGGVCHYSFQLAESLAEAGCDVTLLSTEDHELKELPRCFKLYPLFKKSRVRSLLTAIFLAPRKAASDRMEMAARYSGVASEARSPSVTIKFLKLWRLRMLWLKAILFLLWKGPQVIHFQWVVDRKADSHFIQLLKWLRFTIVYTAHDVLPHDDDTPEARRLFQKLYNFADAVVVHAEKNKQQMIDSFSIDPGKISVIPHGANTLFFKSQDLSREEARARLRMPATRKVVLFFGLIKRYKGLEYLLQAFKQIREQANEATLLIVGSVYNGDPATFQYYSNLLAQFDTQDDVIRVTEYVSFDRVGYYFAAADVVVLPYVKTTQSGILLSAFAAGRPVVVTDTGGLSELVEDGRSGFVVPPRNTQALARAIMEIIKNPGKRSEMGQTAKQLAQTRYSWKTAAAKTIELYQSVTVEPNQSAVVQTIHPCK
jgi:glycosyltransferase involved in cell wall biosynthesis